MKYATTSILAIVFLASLGSIHATESVPSTGPSVKERMKQFTESPVPQAPTKGTEVSRTGRTKVLPVPTKPTKPEPKKVAWPPTTTPTTTTSKPASTIPLTTKPAQPSSVGPSPWQRGPPPPSSQPFQQQQPSTIPSKSTGKLQVAPVSKGPSTFVTNQGVPALPSYFNGYDDYLQKPVYHLLEDMHDQLPVDAASSITWHSDLFYGMDRIDTVLQDTKKTPLEFHQKLTNLYFKDQKQLAALVHNVYKRRRNAAHAGAHLNIEFDKKYFIDFHEAITLFGGIGESHKPQYTFNRQEIFCDVAYFYKLLDFQDAIGCYEITRLGGEELTPNLMAGLFGDALLGYMSREDLVGKEDEEALKRASQTVNELKTGASFMAAGHMLHAALRLWKSHPTTLLEKFLKAMITIRLSGLLYWTKGKSKPKDLYKHLTTHDIKEEHFFAVGTPTHDLLASFKHTDQGKADVAYINSGGGIEKHPQKSLLASQYTETTPTENVADIERFVPFAIYKDRPDQLFVERGGIVDSIDELYFNADPDNAKLEYKDWQYIDDQRAGTCYAIMYWYLPYWLEQGDQHAIENLKLGLQLELLRAAMNDFEATIEKMEELLTEYTEAPKGSIKEAEASKDYEKIKWAIPLKMKLIPFGLNEALQTIRRLHLKGFDMTNVMKDYKKLWDEYREKDAWRLIESKTMDTYVSAHNLILKDIKPLPKRASLHLFKGEQSAVMRKVEGMKKESITPSTGGQGIKAKPHVSSGTRIQALQQALLKSNVEVPSSIPKQQQPPQPKVPQISKPVPVPSTIPSSIPKQPQPKAPEVPKSAQVPSMAYVSGVKVLPSVSKQPPPGIPSKSNVGQETGVSGGKPGSSVKDLMRKFGEKQVQASK